MLEQSFLTSLIKADGSLLAFFTRPIAGVLGAATLVVWGWMALRSMRAAGSPRPAA
jgi:putative tricarboxylic transport membrane protein